MTTGAPMIEVIALIGKVKSVPGSCEKISQKIIVIAPNSNVAQNKR